MSLNVYKGRPEEKRSDVEERSYDLLDSLGIDYLRVDHEPVMTNESCIAPEEALEIMLCKNLFLRNKKKTQYYLLVMPGDKRLDSTYLAHEIGESRLSFGSAEAMDEMIGVTPGSVSLLALMNDPDKKIRLLIDEEIWNDDYLGFHPCKNTSSLKASTADLWEKLLPALGREARIVTLPRESK